MVIEGCTKNVDTQAKEYSSSHDCIKGTPPYYYCNSDKDTVSRNNFQYLLFIILLEQTYGSGV